MWSIIWIVTAFYFIRVNCELKQRRTIERDLEIACSSVCDVCNDIVTDIMRNPGTCAQRCSCLGDIHKMMHDKQILRCKSINAEIFCKLGRKIDDNGCATDNCNTWLPCAVENPLANCSHACPHGYRMDIFGCPTCECRCRSDTIGYSGFVHECSMKCNNRYDVAALRTENCPICNCTGDRGIIQKDECKHRPDCPKNCGTWGVLRICNEHESSCKCDCPMTKLECSNVECAWGPATVAKDEFGCATGCNCPEESVVRESEHKSDLLDCPMSIKCPLECGPYSLKKVFDIRGCLRECRCQCIDPLCHRSCPHKKVLKDMYGCSTCDCLPDWTHCPIICYKSCGSYNRLTPNDGRGCPSTCDCNCPRSVDHDHGIHSSIIPRPPLMCPTSCDQMKISRDRFGCDSCQCKFRQCPSIRCKKNCGPHGFIRDKHNCDTCACNCPKVSRCAPCSNGLYLDDGYGCDTCTCQCPALLECDLDCSFGRLINENGCKICKCAKTPHHVERRVNKDKSECREVNCEEECEFYQRLQNGCKTCRCCKTLVCPGLNCKDGVLEVDENQCPLCKCEKKKKKPLSEIIPLKHVSCTPILDCKVNCPKDFLKVDEYYCPICECCEPVLKKDCPTLRCHKFQTNRNGCPICECDEDVLIPVLDRGKIYHDKERCSEYKCAHHCEHPKIDSHGCHTCDCCPNFRNDCPEVKCKHYEVDRFGCSICRCQQTHLEIPQMPIHKCKYREDELKEKCDRKCDNLLYKVNENNCPICECCSPRLSHDCSSLKCDVYKTDNHGCPICECVEKPENEELRQKSVEMKCPKNLNCKNICRSGFFKSKGQCSSCDCCDDNLARCSDLKCNVYKSDDYSCPICECASFHSNKEASQHSLVNTRCPPLKCNIDCSRVFGLRKLDDNNCHVCECCEPHLDKCPHLKCKTFKTQPKNGCPFCECAEK